MKKILFCDNSLRSLINFRGDVINDYAKEGYDVVLVAPHDCEYMPEYANIKYMPIMISRTGTNPIKDIVYLKNLFSIYRHESPDCIFHYTIKPNIYGTFASALLGIPSSMIITGLGYTFNSNGLGSIIARMLYRCAMSLSKQVIVLNQNIQDKLIENHLVRYDKLILMPGGEGVNLDLFDAKSNQNKTTNGKIVFLMIARVLYDKGYQEYVNAAEVIKKKFPDTEFSLLGSIDNDYPNHVPEYIVKQDTDRGIINYLGFRSDVRDIIVKSDCIVHPSYHEGMSRVLMESLAMGKPIITTDIPGCRETVEDGKNGYIVQPKNAAALVEAIGKFLKLTHEERCNMGICSREKAEKEFDVKNVIKIYKQIFQ